jgi:hypothetical protein
MLWTLPLLRMRCPLRLLSMPNVLRLCERLPLGESMCATVSWLAVNGLEVDWGKWDSMYSLAHTRIPPFRSFISSAERSGFGRYRLGK